MSNSGRTSGGSRQEAGGRRIDRAHVGRGRALLSEPRFEDIAVPQLIRRSAVARRVVQLTQQAVGAQPAFTIKEAIAERVGYTITPAAREPTLHGDAEAALAPPCYALAQVPPRKLAQNRFQLPASQPHVERQRGGELPELRVEEWRARFDRMIHGRAVHLRQVFARES